MKLLITIGMVIIFISVFFMLLIGDSIFSSSLMCTTEGTGTVCNFTGFTGPGLMGMLMIVFFLIIDVFSVYLIISNIKDT